MVLDDPTSQERLTPEARRALLRAFADRMLIKVTVMEDPQDLPGVERAVRTAAVIERIYSRCDRAEAHAPDPRKREAERARHTVDAIHSRASLATAMKWGEQRRQALGPWWDAAGASEQGPVAEPSATPVNLPATITVHAKPQPSSAETMRPHAVTGITGDDAPIRTPVASPQVDYVDYTASILKTRAEMGLANPDASGSDPPPP